MSTASTSSSTTRELALNLTKTWRRLEVRAEAEDDPEVLEQLGAAIDEAKQRLGDLYLADGVYREHPELFVGVECRLLNPNQEPADRPFYPWLFQSEFLRDLYDHYVRGKDLLNEKSRQMGASWLLMAFFLWGLMFRDEFTGLAISYKQDLVDDGGEESTPDSLFGKIRFIYDRLRDELKEYAPLRIRHLGVANRATGAYLVGESANPNAGAGGTYRIGLWDETARTPRSEVIFQAWKQAVNVHVYNSTSQGRGNVFSRLRHDPESGITVNTMHWSIHPLRIANLRTDPITGRPTSDWYEAECRGMTDVQIAQELDIDYEVSTHGRIYGKLSARVHLLDDLEYGEHWETILAWDLGVSDETFCAVLQKDSQGNVGLVDELLGTDEEIRFYIDLIHGFVPDEVQYMPAGRRRAYQRFAERAAAREYVRYPNVAGPDVTQRTITGKRSVRQQFTEAGKLSTKARRYRNLRMLPITGFSVLDRIVAVRTLLDPSRNRFAVSGRCVSAWERLTGYKWAQTPDGENRQQPLHDWCSHAADAVGYGVLYFGRRRKPGQKPRGV